MNKMLFVSTALCGMAGGLIPLYAQEKPNIIIIYTDDMGIGDLSCYNSGWVMTPNIDRLAAQGLKFNKYYTSSPVSSPSRVGITTGIFPTEWGINTYLSHRKMNTDCEQFDYLDPSAPTMAKSLKKVGYATAHIGKWHMGGGRDVDDAPQITQYGFDEYLTTYEGPNPDKLIPPSNWIWSEKDSIQRWDRTAYFVDKTLDFLKRHNGMPCFINLWPDDMHDPWIPSAGYYRNRASWTGQETFMAVLDEYDRQIGRFMDGLNKLGLSENTIVIFTSDNGAYPTFDSKRVNSHRGSKVSLYEGGINLPFIICWPNRIKGGETDDETLINAVDIYPSLCAIVGAEPLPGYKYSGEDMSRALLGKKTLKREKDMMWDFGRSKYFHRPAQKYHQSSHLAIRRGDMKLLINSDGSRLELYNIKKDPNETTNIASKYPQLCDELSNKLIAWYFEKRKQRGM